MIQSSPKVVIIIQARTGSNRLPFKVLKPLLGVPMLSRVVERVSLVNHPHTLCVATTQKKEDNKIEDLCKRAHVACFRGSELNVLKRYYDAAHFLNADVVVRITADCPLIDPHLIDEAIATFLQKWPTIDFVANTLDRTYPRGMDCEVISINALNRLYSVVKDKEDKEHVTLYIYRHLKEFSCISLKQEKNEGKEQLSVDTLEDFERAETIYHALYPKNSCFTLADIRKYEKF